MLDEARSNGNSPPHELVSEKLSFTAIRRSFTTSRADVKSVTRPPSISSFELYKSLHQLWVILPVELLTWMACPISASMTARMSAITPFSSHWRPIEARTIEARMPRLAKPIPAPYSDRARVNVSCSCGVGAAGALYVWWTNKV